MTSKIMMMADVLDIAYEGGLSKPDIAECRAALEVAIQAEHDYTRSVVNERDAYKTSLEATKGEVYRLLSARDAYQVEADKLAAENKQLRDQVHTCHAGCSKAGCINFRLRKAAQMALEALENHCGNYKLDDAGCIRHGAAVDTLRKELGNE